ncbi:MAG: phosphohydrolase [Lachnospiraceae bacterium]|nr:phosphohydrolase [Lachnospiraceae bacterium]
MRIKISKNDRRLIKHEIELLSDGTQYKSQSEFIQHGDTSVLKHCYSVTCLSLSIARHLKVKTYTRALIRGALLHDYFLYDWHDPDPSHKLHGFKHPRTALNNAMRDFKLSKKEQNIILRHMFPLTPIPPLYYEAWIVCIADKICSTLETLHCKISIIYY